MTTAKEPSPQLSGQDGPPQRSFQQRGSAAVRVSSPVLRLVLQRAYRRYGYDLAGMRAYLDWVTTAASRGDRRPAGCVVAEGSLGGMPTREFETPNAVPGRTVLYLHGGGFIFYARNAYDGFALRLADQLRARVIVPEYRLAPEHAFPAGVDDCFAAYEALLARGQDPGLLVVAGESAGANATLVTLQRARDAALPLPAGAVMLSGAFDFTGSSPSIKTNAASDVAIGPYGYRFLLRWFRPDVPTTDPMLSPVFGDFTGLPPLLFQAGSVEMLVDDSVRAAARARSAEVRVRLEIYPDAPHAWHQLGSWLPEARTALRQIGEFARDDCGW